MVTGKYKGNKMKDLKISEELICEVLGLDPTSGFNYSIEDNQIVVSNLGEQLFEVNIYEFAFKCKEWALTKGYFIYSTNELSFIKSFSLETIETFSNGKDTEIECILKACEWILENKDNK